MAYKLSLNQEQLTEIIKLTGGFPYLINLIFFHLAKNKTTLTEIINNVTNESSIFYPYLSSLTTKLEREPKLIDSFKLWFQTGTKIAEKIALKLEGLGLIYSENHQIRITCQLYQDYFSNYFYLNDAKKF